MAADSYAFGPFQFGVSDRQLLRDGQPVELTPKTSLLLLALLEAGGHIVTREALDRRVWGDANVGLGSLPFQIHLLRRALGDSGEGQRLVQTVPRIGYRLAVPVRALEAAASAGHAVHPESGLPAASGLGATGATAGRQRLRTLGYVSVLIAMASVATVGMWRTSPTPKVTGFHQLTRDGRSKGGPVQIDGRRVLYRNLDGFALESVPIAGGDATLASAALRDHRILDFSPRRAEYLAVALTPLESSWTLWAVPAAGGPSRRIGQAACAQATWSPSGDRIACATADALVVLAHDGTAAHVVARPTTGQPTWPRWSPDGQRLAFTVEVRANRVVTSTVWEVRSDGSGKRELVAAWPSTVSRCCASWSPDGRYLVFASHEAEHSDLWLVRASAANGTTAAPVRLTNGPLTLFAPAWSPDGRQIVALGVARGGEMVRYDARLGEFVPFLGGLSATWLSFSRDGAWIAYSAFPDGALWRARADGSDRHRLTPPMDVQESSWSPDGLRIAFRTETGSEATRLYVIARDGGEPQAIPTPGPSIGMPTWSPDGRQLAISDVPGTFGHPEGTEAVRLYDFDTQRWSAIPGSDGLWRARWSPDGHYIAALTIRGQQLRLYDTQQGTWRTVAADHINSPTWSRDGRHIYYDTEGNVFSLRRVGIPDGPVDVVASLTGFSRAAYWWSGLSLDDSPILLRNIGAVEVYSLDVNGL